MGRCSQDAARAAPASTSPLGKQGRRKPGGAPWRLVAAALCSGAAAMARTTTVAVCVAVALAVKYPQPDANRRIAVDAVSEAVLENARGSSAGVVPSSSQMPTPTGGERGQPSTQAGEHTIVSVHPHHMPAEVELIQATLGNGADALASGGGPGMANSSIQRRAPGAEVLDGTVSSGHADISRMSAGGSNSSGSSSSVSVLQNIATIDGDGSVDDSMGEKLLLGSLCFLFTICGTAMLLLWFCSRSRYQRDARLLDQDGPAGGREQAAELQASREDLVERLACMLETSVLLNLDGQTRTRETVSRYVAIKPASHPIGRGQTLQRWIRGFLGVWEAQREFTNTMPPLASCSLASIAKVEQSQLDTCVVVVIGKLVREAGITEFKIQFPSEAEARLWANSLVALLEQLKD